MCVCVCMISLLLWASVLFFKSVTWLLKNLALFMMRIKSSSENQHVAGAIKFRRNRGMILWSLNFRPNLLLQLISTWQHLCKTGTNLLTWQTICTPQDKKQWEGIHPSQQVSRFSLDIHSVEEEVALVSMVTQCGSSSIHWAEKD